MATTTNEIVQNLDELFRMATNQSVGKPMRLRDLPASFFTPPPTGTKSASHSRESSIDQQSKRLYYKALPSTPNTGNSTKNMIINQQQQHPKLTLLNNRIAHSRAHSSPASLQKTLSVIPHNQNNQNNQNTINQLQPQQQTQQSTPQPQQQPQQVNGQQINVPQQQQQPQQQTIQNVQTIQQQPIGHIHIRYPSDIRFVHF